MDFEKWQQECPAADIKPYVALIDCDLYQKQRLCIKENCPLYKFYLLLKKES